MHAQTTPTINGVSERKQDRKTQLHYHLYNDMNIYCFLHHGGNTIRSLIMRLHLCDSL